jgi:hypothetical protein
MNRTRTIRAILAAPILAAGVLATTLTAAGTAVAQPTSGSACTSMAMPETQSNAGTPNSLTRAGQVGTANAPAQAPDAPMDCTAAGHG